MKKYILGLAMSVAIAIGGCTTEDVEPIPGSNGSKVSLTASSLAIFEDGGMLDITAILSSVSDADVKVSISYAGDATITQDYNAEARITIPAGQLSASITLSAINDTDEEGVEQIEVSISSVEGSSEDGEQLLVINLEDDDVEATVSIVLNEILYDPSNSGLEGDANGDGNYTQSEDEFVEFINTSSQSLDMSGYMVFDLGSLNAGTPNHIFPAGSIVESGKAIVVFGGGTPTGAFGGAVVQKSTSGDLNLNNAGDEMILQDADGVEVLRFDIEPLSGNPNESYTRSPDLTGDFEQHGSNQAILFSPGTKVDGSPF
jgi:hypothetical protein